MSVTRSAHEVELLANAMRHDIITMLYYAKSGHPGGSLSCADILATVWFSGVMNYDENEPKSPDRDLFVLSKGHAAPTLYAAYHQLGWVRDDELPTLRHLGSRLQGHPDCKALEPVELCSGSLGQGLSVSAGAALGFVIDGTEGARTRHVFCVCGDGEMQEGSNWEALMFAANNGLYNLTLYVDLNNLQIDGDVRDINSLGNIDVKLEAFGWHVIHTDGHDVPRLIDATNEALGRTDKPTAIVCDTVKGKGVSFMENQVGWHGKAPNEEETKVALADLDAELAQLKKEAR